MKAKSFARRLLRRFFGTVLAVVVVLFAADYGLGKLGLYLYPKDYADYVEKYSNQYGVDTNFCFAMIKCESNFDERAVSSAGAKGLMQMTPDTYHWVCEKLYGMEIDEELLFDPETNIKCGIWYISYLKAQFSGEKEVIAAYNAGPAHVREWLNDQRYSSDGVTLEKLPFKETERHIKKVLNARDIYRKLYE